MAAKYSDSWHTTLTSSPSAGSGVTFTVNSVGAAPTIAAGDWTYVRLNDLGGTAENVKITSISGSTLTAAALVSSHTSGEPLDGTVFNKAMFDQLKIDAVATYGQGLEPGGTLTLTSGNPEPTSDVTSSTNIYYTPHKGNVITLWDSTQSLWVPITFSEYTLAIGTVTSDLPYDVFAYYNAGALGCEKLAWTNGTTRATALAWNDGRRTKSGAKDRLYLGTFRASSTTATADSVAKRYLWNRYHQRPKPCIYVDATNHTCSTSFTGRFWNNDTTAHADFVLGEAANVQATIYGRWEQAASILFLSVDTTTCNAGDAASMNNAGGYDAANVFVPGADSKLLAAGNHTINLFEQADGTSRALYIGGFTATVQA